MCIAKVSELQCVSCTTTVIFSRTGILVFGPEGSEKVNSVAASLSTHGVDHQVFSGSEANSRYPQQLNLPENYQCVFEVDGGILRASKAVAALQVALDVFVFIHVFCVPSNKIYIYVLRWHCTH